MHSCSGHSANLQLRPKICCFFENLALNYFTFTVLHSTDKFSNEHQILGLNWLTVEDLEEDFVVHFDGDVGFVPGAALSGVSGGVFEVDVPLAFELGTVE